jgi:hypothetical protein
LSGAIDAGAGAGRADSYFTDMLLRSPGGEVASDAQRSEINRILLTDLAAGKISGADRSYLPSWSPNGPAWRKAMRNSALTRRPGYRRGRTDPRGSRPFRTLDVRRPAAGRLHRRAQRDRRRPSPRSCAGHYLKQEKKMRSILLWMLGVPLPIIILIALIR